MSGERAKRGPYAKTQHRRASIAAAALQLINERGDADVGIAEVAERAGVTEATILYHFPTRDHVLVAALEEADEVNRRVFEEVDMLGMDVAEVVSMLATTAAGHPHRMQLYTSQASNAADPGHPAHAWFLKHQKGTQEYLSWVLRRDQAEGRAHEDVDPEQFARQMIALWDGLQMQKLSDPTLDLPRQVTDAYRSLARVDLVEARRALESLVAGL
ncbi:TetR/AcrR family transcriptional regulator [Microbacterium sp. AGC85]